MTVREPPPAAPPPPTAPLWVGPLAGAAVAVLIAGLGRAMPALRPLAAPWALLGHGLAFGVIVAMLAEALGLLRRQTWAEQAVQACLDQVRATPSLTDRHEILHLHRERWQAQIGGRLFLAFVVAMPTALAGLLAVLARLPKPGAPLSPSALLLPLTVATAETLAACLAVSLVWRGWSLALVGWEGQALEEYHPVARAGATAWDTPSVPPPVSPIPPPEQHPPTNGQAEPVPPIVDPVPPPPPETKVPPPDPFGGIWGQPTQESVSAPGPFGSPFGNGATEAATENDDDPGPDYGR